MAQPPRHSSQQHSSHSRYGTKPSTDRQGAEKDRHPTPRDDEDHEQGEYKDQHVPLRDPSEGQVPAIVSGSLVDPNAPAPQQYVDPDPAWTIADEQRARSEEIESMGVEAWKDANDSRTEEEKAAGQPQIEGVAFRGENVSGVVSRR